MCVCRRHERMARGKNEVPFRFGGTGTFQLQRCQGATTGKIEAGAENSGSSLAVAPA